MKKKEVIEMLHEMQLEVYQSELFETAGETQKWIIEHLIGEKIENLGGKPYGISPKKNLVESYTAHPTEYDISKNDEEFPVCRYENIQRISMDSFFLTLDIVQKAVECLIKFDLGGQGIFCEMTDASYEFELHNGEIQKKSACTIYGDEEIFLKECDSKEQAKIIYDHLLEDVKSQKLSKKAFLEIQEEMLRCYVNIVGFEEIKDISDICFLKLHMPEKYVIKLYQNLLYAINRKRLITNIHYHRKDSYFYQRYDKDRWDTGQNVISGELFDYNPERFNDVFDGTFDEFIETFDFKEKGFQCIEDACRLGDTDLYIGKETDFNVHF